MATEVYGFVNGKGPGQKLFAGEVNTLGDTLEGVLLGLSRVWGRCVLRADDLQGAVVEGALAVDVGAGAAFAGADGALRLVWQEATVRVAGLYPNETNRVYVLGDGSFAVRKTGEGAPAAGTLCCACVTNQVQATSIDGAPVGRVNLQEPRRVIALATHGVTIPTLGVTHRITARWDGEGVFGDRCVVGHLRCDEEGVIVTPEANLTNEGRGSWTIYVSPSYYGSGELVLEATVAGYGWTGGPGPVEAVWSEPEEVV